MHTCQNIINSIEDDVILVGLEPVEGLLVALGHCGSDSVGILEITYRNNVTFLLGSEVNGFRALLHEVGGLGLQFFLAGSDSSYIRGVTLLGAVVVGTFELLKRAVEISDIGSGSSMISEGGTSGGDFGVILGRVVLFLLNWSILGLDYVVN